MENKPDPTVLSVAGMICASFVVVFLLGSITYGCTAPNQATPMDYEAQAKRIVELRKISVCVRAGGAWMPVTSRTSVTEMSCVTKDTLPLVEKMNDRKDS
jgi:hypothetical protein